MTHYLVFAIVLTAPPALGAEKLPVPPDAALEAPLALIKEVYGEEHANAKTNEQLQALAKKLLSDASKTDKPIDSYALLRVARDMATQGCDGQTAFQIIDEMERAFQVDAVRMKASVLYSLSKKARLPADRKSIAEQALALVNLAVARDDLELSGKLAEMALSEARKLRDADYVKSVAARSKEIEELGRAFLEVKAEAARLEEAPTDPEANLAVGRYRCLVKGDWESGLPMLALGSDAALKELAIKELDGVSDASGQVALGDGWWELAEREEGTRRKQLLARAGYWYTQASAKLEGLSKSKVDRRLSQIREIAVPATRKEFSIDLGGVKMEFVLIPAGEFMMGSSESERQLVLQQAKARKNKGTIERIPTEGPQHRVKISKPFYLGKYEVTQAQWQAVMGNNPSQFNAPMHPVEKVSWDDTRSFLAKLNAVFRRKGIQFGLPTEAQWEYACRAGTTTAFSFGDNAALLSRYGWFKDNSGEKTHPVGQKKPNAWGLYDMHGNVWEWCADWYGADYYRQSPPADPTGPPAGSNRVDRGGGRDGGGCRSAYRGRCTPGFRRSNLGFRVALVPVDASGR